jgi:glycine betaine/choline ABC-type transport system substrate-binding protein
LDEAFAKLNNAITTDDMRRMNYEVDGNKKTPRDVAADWLRSKQ